MKQYCNNIEMGDLVCFTDSEDKDLLIKFSLCLFLEKNDEFIVVYDFKHNSKRKYQKAWYDYLRKI
jgi:hypothetical protein